MRKRLLLFFLFPVFVAQSQVFNAPAGAIKNDSTFTVFNIIVAGVTNPLTPTYGLKRATLNIQHPAVQELHIYLKSPNGVAIALSVSNGPGVNYTNTVFENSSSNSIRNGTPPFSGTFRPENSLAIFNINSIAPNGTWTLSILDDQKNLMSGTLQNFNLEFGTNPAQPTPFTVSNLPVFVVNTNYGLPIPTINDIRGKMFILDKPGGLNYMFDTQTTKVLPIGIHVRGNSSQGGPKDPYSFSPLDVNGVDSNMSILGMPSENDWVLNNAYFDQSFMRDVLSFYLSNRMGQYASRTRFCELVINGDYRGIYCLMERIKQDKNRVDIATLNPEDTSGAEVTGGYILKKDGGAGLKDSGFVHTLSGFTYLYDDPDSPVIQQKKYIKAYMDTAVGALLNKPLTDTVQGYRHFIDYKSAIDYIIICEFGVSGDTYNRSTYWYKHKITKGNKLYFGPVWDFNFGFNSPTMGFKFPSFVPYKKMYDDTFFKKELWCKYNYARSTFLSPNAINAVIDSFIAPLYDAMYRNDERWFQNKSGTQLIQNCYYRDACYYLKKYSFDRLHVMDSFLRSNCVNVQNTCKPKLDYTISNACSGDSAVIMVNTTSSNVFILPATGVRKVTNYKFVIATPGGTGSYKIIWNNCFSYDTVTFTLSGGNMPTLQCIGKDTVTTGDSVLLVITGASFYTWSPAITTLNAIGDSAYVKPFSTTTYTIVGYTGTGCNSAITKQVAVVPKNRITLYASADSLCSGAMLKLKATGAPQYIWDINNLLYLMDSIIIYPTVNLLIKLTGMDSGIPTDFLTKTIKVFPVTKLNVTPKTPTYTGAFPIMIVANGAVTYNWTPTQGLNRYDNDTVFASPAVSTLYTINAIDSHNCATTSTIYVTSTVGIRNEKKEYAIVVHPNPVKSEMSIDVSPIELMEDRAYALYDVIGQKVLEGTLKEQATAVNVSSLAPGIYLLKIDGTIYKMMKE